MRRKLRKEKRHFEIRDKKEIKKRERWSLCVCLCVCLCVLSKLSNHKEGGGVEVGSERNSDPLLRHAC